LRLLNTDTAYYEIERLSMSTLNEGVLVFKESLAAPDNLPRYTEDVERVYEAQALNVSRLGVSTLSHLIRTCCREIDPERVEVLKASLVNERPLAVLTLRIAPRNGGPNDEPTTGHVVYQFDRPTTELLTQARTGTVVTPRIASTEPLKLSWKDRIAVGVTERRLENPKQVMHDILTRYSSQVKSTDRPCRSSHIFDQSSSWDFVAYYTPDFDLRAHQLLNGLGCPTVMTVPDNWHRFELIK